MGNQSSTSNIGSHNNNTHAPPSSTLNQHYQQQQVHPATSVSSIDTTPNTSLPPGHPAVPANHPSMNPLARAGGCPMAKHPASTSASSYSASTSEPPDTDTTHIVPPPSTQYIDDINRRTTTRR